METPAKNKAIEQRMQAYTISWQKQQMWQEQEVKWFSQGTAQAAIQAGTQDATASLQDVAA